VINNINNWYDRGKKAGPAATRYRRGACENCGAITHKRQDCLERPRKKGAKFTGKDIKADDLIQESAAGFDAKRDRWNGYDARGHKVIYDEYVVLEAARQKLREEEIDRQTTTNLSTVQKVAKAGKGDNGGDDPDFGSSDEDDADEEKYADAADAVGQKLDTKTRITVRNLRIREDTAKYLQNLDPESAYYDPKTRSMRDAPDRNVNPEDARFAGDNFARFSGDAPEVQKLQLFAWQAAARGNEVHLNANPTQGEILHKQFKEKKEVLKESAKVGILAKYGGEEYLEKVPKELLQGQTEEYVEYSRAGQVIKGKEKVKTRSKYLEDVFINNHTAVWGSWYSTSTGQWGYACCHSAMHASYCSGLAGIEAASASTAESLLASASNYRAKTPEDDTPAETRRDDLNNSLRTSKRNLGDVDVQLDQKKLAEAMKEEKRRRDFDGDEDMKSKKRKHGDGVESSKHDVTEEELEAYRRTRLAGTEDPMFNYKDPDE